MKKSNWNTTKPFGYHLAMDLYHCNPNKIRRIEIGYSFLDKIPDIIETDIQSPPFIVHKKNIGFAGWIPVVDSGISLYAFFPKNFVTVDVYTCKRFDTKKIKEFTQNLFSPTRTKEYYFLRGEDYIPPIELIRIKEETKVLEEK